MHTRGKPTSGSVWKGEVVICLAVVIVLVMVTRFEFLGRIVGGVSSHNSWLIAGIMTFLILIGFAAGILFQRKWKESQIQSTADGPSSKIMSTVGDRTERNLAEELLREANIRALRNYERLVERIAVLGQTLGNAHDLITIYRALRDFSEVSTSCAGMVISLYDPTKQTRRVSYCWTDKTEFDPKDVAEIPVGKGMTGRAMESRSVIIDNNYQAYLGKLKDAVTVGKCPDDSTPKSALIAPMIAMGRIVGSVEIQSYQEGAYTNEHASAMRVAANLAATAVENVTLVERAQAKEKQLRQAQKMEAIGQLAGGIAHDFNNILAAIIGNCELALLESSAESPVDRRLKGVLTAANRAKELVRQILTFSRQEEPERQPLLLQSITDEVLKLLRSSLPSTMEIRQNLDLAAPPILGNATQMHQVIMNLGTNASQAIGGAGGVMEVSLDEFEIDVEFAETYPALRPGAHIRLVFRDNGCGLNQAAAERIFEPFFTTKAPGAGTGLGLSVVHGIVMTHGGAVSVSSEEGKGTTFTLYFPVADRDTTAFQLASFLPTRGEQVQLVVEEYTDAHHPIGR